MASNSYNTEAEKSVELCSRTLLSSSFDENGHGRILEIVVVKKKDQFHDGSTKDMILQEQAIVLKKGSKFAPDTFDKESHKEFINDLGGLKEFGFTKSKLKKFFAACNKERAEVASFSLDYENQEKLTYGLQIMASKGYKVGSQLALVPLTREFSLPDGGKYQDELLIQLILDDTMRVSMQMMLQRKNVTTKTTNPNRSVLLKPKDVAKLYDLIFVKNDGQWLSDNFPTLYGDLAPVLIDQDGKRIPYVPKTARDVNEWTLAAQSTEDMSPAEIAAIICSNKSKAPVKTKKRVKAADKVAADSSQTDGKNKKRKRQIVFSDSEDEEVSKKRNNSPTLIADDYLEDSQAW